VIVPSTPAQLFHALRRQVHRAFRKPLVVMTPKSLLRHPRSVSALADLTGGGFEPVLDDPAAGARRVLLCSGRIFFALDEARQASGRADVAIVRVEELYPFPEAAVRRALARHGAAREIVWIQEEPANQGAWSFVRPRLAAMLGDRPLRYVGRGEAASPATGSYHVHQHEEAGIVRAALDGAAAPDMTRRDGDSDTGQAVS
jgi:2-oxoglutarate dehydrogenase E1 component